MRALGIDPGTRLTGWGAVDAAGDRLRHLGSGTIVLPVRESVASRLARLHAACHDLVRRWRPDAVVLERAFVAGNVHSALRLGEARGAVLAAVAAAGIVPVEFAPAAVKRAAVGHGRADKESVGRSVTVLLGLGAPPDRDAADALALALCWLQQAPLRSALARAGEAGR